MRTYLNNCVTIVSMKKKPKPKLKPEHRETPTIDFFDLLHKAITPLSKAKGRKVESEMHGENISKRTHQRKAEAIEG